MTRQELKLSNGQQVSVQIEDGRNLLEVVNRSGIKVEVTLTLEDMEELSDLMTDSFYKAGRKKNKVGKGVHNG